MKTLIKSSPSKGIWLSDSPTPSFGVNDVLIKVKQTAICGTDIHIYNWDNWAKQTIPLNMAVGHEFVGIIEKVGTGVTGINIGDRVSGEGHITCGACRNCRIGKRHLCRYTVGVGVNRPGAFSEYLVLPATNVFKIPSNISDEMAAILDPLGNATHTALSFDLTGEDVLITGAGPIGIMSAVIAKHVGAKNVVITDINPYRLELAQQFPALHTVNLRIQSLDQTMEQLDIKEGFGVAFEMSGTSDAFNDILNNISHGGKVAMLGILSDNAQIDWNKIIFKSVILKGIYGREIYDTWYKMIAMLQSGLDISPIITHRYSFDDFQQGFDAMLSGQSGKVILKWT